MISFAAPTLWLTSLLSFAACLLLVATKKFHGRFTLDASHGIQRTHSMPTPRVGGLGVYLSLLGADLMLADTETGTLLTYMLLAGLPAFVVGFMEDLFKRGEVWGRLAATFASALVACWLFNLSLTRVDVPGFDLLLTWLPFSVAFTALGVAGVANAVNIIDGFNGLAAGTVMVAAAALGLIAWQAGDAPLAGVCLVLIFAVLGFGAMNFPLGKIFLGDGGAYLLGFMLGWLAVMLPMRNPEVSPWASLLACGYPVIEAVFSLMRRIQRKTHFSQPDRLHLHSLLKSRFIRKRWGWLPSVFQNSATSIPLWAFSALMAWPAVVYARQPDILLLCFVAALLSYWVWYLRLVRFGREFRTKSR